MIVLNLKLFTVFWEGSEGCNASWNILSVFDDNDHRDNVVLNKFTFTESDYENGEDCKGNCD